jgi:SAM-dependent methyltransferase
MEMFNCRLCSKYLSEPFLSLGSSPLSNSYLSESQLNQPELFYPLELYVCPDCFLVQLNQFERADKIFSEDYAYHSSYSATWLKHCQDYTEMMINKLNLTSGALVIEIASNDGYLLQYFQENNIPVLGIEPTTGTAQVALKKNINTEIAFFSSEFAAKLQEESRQADLLIGNNVLAHTPYLNDFTEGLKIALKPGGVITMEFPHLLSLLRENQFDTIYHEHFSYFSLNTVQKLFAGHGLEIFDIDELSTHGGSLRIYGKHKEDQGKAVSEKINLLLEKEKAFGLENPETYNNFREKVLECKRKLLAYLIKLKSEGKRIAGYGAPAKGNTLLNYCGIRNDFLDYTVDLSPYKQNKFLPGTRIPVYHPDKIKEDKPDYILILPWNIKAEIMEQVSYIRDWGGKFLIPVPEIEVK